MTKQEFVMYASRGCTNDDYANIEMVYMYHPSISNKDGKEQIARLWDTFGPRIIADMLPTAEKALEYDRQIAAARLAYDRLCEEYEQFCSGAQAQ